MEELERGMVAEEGEWSWPLLLSDHGVTKRDHPVRIEPTTKRETFGA